MDSRQLAKVLVVPGIGNSGPAHWQSLWEARHPNFQRVQQRDWDRPIRDEWVAAIDAAVVESGADTKIVAHSLGCLAVVAWAAQTRRVIRHVLLVAVPDPSGEAFPSEAVGFSSVSILRLPFESIVVASTDDPYSSVAYASRCATAWGSEYLELGARGHINASSGLGYWPDGLALIRK
jgi:predicted alpha/beta hydrolase family esterase